MLVGNAKKVRFKGKGRYRSVEGKTNKQGIRFKDECLVWGKLKKGSKKWNRSKRYLKIQHKKAEIQRRQQEHRKSLHGKLVNEVIRQGNHFKMEKVSVIAWQKNWGKHIGYKSPGEFQSRLSLFCHFPKSRSN